MQKPLALVLFLLVAAAAVCLWFLWREDAAPPPRPGPDPVAATDAAAEAAGRTHKDGVAAPGTIQRTQVGEAAHELLDDPDIRAGLTGFRGRVVDHSKVPVAECGVRIYRGALDVVMTESVDLFADEPTAVPNYVAGEAKTLADGTFLIAGVWPRAIYIMFAGIGTDAPMHQIITRTPSPGQVVDLGDIVLPDAGVIIGSVVDDDGEPLPGALVRAADLPGTVAGFFPAERFDPEGALLIRETRAPVSVVEMPGWVKNAFEHLPIPSTHTDTAGNFRLVGVTPGSNLLATTAKDYLSDMKPSVQVRAGQEKDVGRIRLSHGEELTGVVLDTAGKPVPEAEILAGSTILIAPVDLARRVGKANAEGKFSALGFAPGKVTVAARRGPGHAWVLAEPQQISGDVVVTLPATFAVALSITLSDGKPAAEPRIKILSGTAGDGAAEMAVFGFVPPVDLRERLARVEAGQWRVTNLPKGKFTVIADAPGHATGFAAFTIEEGDAKVALQLTTKKDFVVRVLGGEDKPIRNVAIYAEASGKKLLDMPMNCGRTKADGRLVIDRFEAETLRVSADHPRWGVVHGEVKLGEELVLRMQPPGSLEGFLTENGAPPEAGKFTILVQWRGEGRGPMDQVPMMITAGADGAFQVAALQPGHYQVSAMDSLDSLRSPGGMMSLFMMASMSAGDTSRETVEVFSGQTSQVRLDAGEKPIEGPTAHLFGTVMVDGQLASGYVVMSWMNNRRFNAKVEPSGRFDMGIVPVGNAWVTVSSPDGGFMGISNNNVWSSSIELKEAEEHELNVEIMTSSMSGTVVFIDGRPFAGGHVAASGQLKGGGSVRSHAPVDAEGRFRFDKVPEGTWSLEVRGGGEETMRGKLDKIVVAAGVPVSFLRIEVEPAIVVKGRVDLAVLGTSKPRWAWLSIHKLNEVDNSFGDQAAGIGLNMSNGDFSTDDLSVGRYAVRLHAGGDKDNKTYRCQNLDVTRQGLANVLLAPVPE